MSSLVNLIGKKIRTHSSNAHNSSSSSSSYWMFDKNRSITVPWKVRFNIRFENTQADFEIVRRQKCFHNWIENMPIYSVRNQFMKRKKFHITTNNFLVNAYIKIIKCGPVRTHFPQFSTYMFFDLRLSIGQ